MAEITWGKWGEISLLIGVITRYNSIYDLYRGPPCSWCFLNTHLKMIGPIGSSPHVKLRQIQKNA